MNLSALSLTALALVLAGCASLPPVDAAGPVGTWQLVSLGGEAPAVPASLTLGADGRVSGSTGCNRLTGTYALAPDGALTFGPLATTRMACAPAAMTQERRMLDTLEAATRAEVEDGRLVLSRDGNRLLVFEAGPAASASDEVTGTVTYLPRIALPQDATITVRLLDVSRADAPAETLAEEAIAAEGRSVPVPFALRYDPGAVDARSRYVVRADIRDGMGSLLWTTDTAVPVLTDGAPSSGVEVRLVQVPDDAVGSTAGDLVGFEWRVRLVQAPSGVTLTLDWDAPYTLRFHPDGRYSGGVDCNRIGGTFRAQADGALTLGQGFSTLAACPEGSASGDVLRVLAEVDHYAVGGDRLELRGEAGTLVLVRDDEPGSPNTGALPGPEWELSEIRSASGAATPPLGEGRYTIRFQSDGHVSGRADCNRYGGAFEAHSTGDLVLTNTATTIAACAPPSSSLAFFGVLNQLVGFDTAGGRLTLRAADGSALVFEREGWMAPQQTGRDMAYTCASPDGPFTFRTRTGPGEIAVWLPERFEGREGGTYRVLGQVRSASGAKYQDGPVTVWTKGTDYALLEVDGQEFLTCPTDPERAGRLQLRSTGNGWYLEITEADDDMRLHLFSTFEDRHADATVTQDGARTVYLADGWSVATLAEPCTDPDTGDQTDTRIELTLDGRTHLGCGQRVD